jgi:hypothetical protein
MFASTVPIYYTTRTAEYYTEAPKYNSAMSYIIKTDAAKYYIASTSYTTTVSSYIVEPKYFTEAPIITAYATLSYYTEAANSYSPRVTTLLRHLNITPKPTLLQLTTGTFLN